MTETSCCQKADHLILFRRLKEYSLPTALPSERETNNIEDHCPLYAKKKKKREERSLSRETNLWDIVISGLSFYTTEKALSEAFSQHGQVIEAKIVTDRVSDRSKGFGFVTYASEDEAEKALQEMNGKPLNGRVVFVDYAKPKTDGGSTPIARGPPEPPVEQWELPNRPLWL